MYFAEGYTVPLVASANEDSAAPVLKLQARRLGTPPDIVQLGRHCYSSSAYMTQQTLRKSLEPVVGIVPAVVVPAAAGAAAGAAGNVDVCRQRFVEPFA